MKNHKFIEKEDLEVLRAARKVLKKLQKKENKLFQSYSLHCQNKSDYSSRHEAYVNHMDMLDEFSAIGIIVSGDGILCLDSRNLSKKSALPFLKTA